MQDAGNMRAKIQEMHYAKILRFLRRKRALSRAELSRLTGLNQSTISNMVKTLLDVSLVRETGLIEGAKGRRSIGVVLNTDTLNVLVVRLARRFVTATVLDCAGHTRWHQNLIVRPGETPTEVVATIVKLVSQGLNIVTPTPIVGIGVVVPGPFMNDTERIALMTDFPGWDTVQLGSILRKQFALPVVVEHVARASALAEWWYGPTLKTGDILVSISGGYGLGSGIVMDGMLFSGANGIGGEIGHMTIDFDGLHCDCGNIGCLEQYASVRAVERDVQQQITAGQKTKLTSQSTFAEILHAFKEEDEVATAALERCATYLGIGLVNVINTLNPSRIVLGDELALSGLPFLARVKETVQQHILPAVYERVDIVLSRFIDQDAAVIGGSAVVLDHVLSQPLALFSAQVRH